MKNEHTYTISEIETMIGLYDAQLALLYDHLEVTRRNSVLTNFITDNKKRIPSNVRLDINCYSKELGRTIQTLIDNINKKMDTLADLKNDMLDEIEEMYGDDYSGVYSTEVLDDLAEVFEDYDSTETTGEE